MAISRISPFAPDAASATDGGGLGSRVWDVGALCLAVSDSLDARFNPVTVRGELTGVTLAASGHRYFTLKDGRGQLRCAMFRRAVAGLDFVPREGDLVELGGRLGVYEARGELQLVVESMRRAGAGSLFEQFLRLKERLQDEGLFDPGRKREVRAMPRALAVVTSLGAAALHDVISALQRRAPYVPVYVFPAAVQGAAAPGELVAALKSAQAAASELSIDTVLLVRGGGSLEDLWAFNDEDLARAVVACAIPVVCGVGHETDFSIADFCADLRAPTPTAAAEFAAQPLGACLDELRAAEQAMRRASSRRVESAQQRVDRVSSRLGRPSGLLMAQGAVVTGSARRLSAAVTARFQSAEQRAEGLSPRLASGVGQSLRHKGEGLGQLRARHHLLDPAHVLARGYAILRTSDGRCLTRTAAIAAGEPVTATLVDGEVDLLAQTVRLSTQNTNVPFSTK